MKPGRPKSHIKGKWVTWKENNKISFYELDQKENLIRTNGQIQIHHSISIDEDKQDNQVKYQNDSNQVVLKPKALEIDNFVKDSTSKTPISDPKLNEENKPEEFLDCAFDFSSVLNGENEDYPFLENIPSEQDDLWWN